MKFTITLRKAIEQLRRSTKFQLWGRNLVVVEYKSASVNHRFEERHFTSSQLAQLWGTSSDTIRRIFEPEPGVLKIGDPRPRKGRKYVTLRIPESVAVRVHTRLCSAPIKIKV